MGEQVTPRDYQVELFQAALSQNIIVYLPTGSGKTFVAALLIKEKSYEISQPVASGGKRTIFLVPTIVLAGQQAAFLRRHTHLTVKEFYGSSGGVLWKGERWRQEFEANQVLVMTAQIFVDILNHNYFPVQKINLVVFDECHAAVKDSPMRQVLTKLQECDSSSRPKILGLTAALFRKKCKPEKVRQVIQNLADSMGCAVKIPFNIETVFRNSTKPCELIIQYADADLMGNEDAKKFCDFIKDKLASLNKLFWPRYGIAVGSPKELIDSCSNNNLDNNEKVLIEALNSLGFMLSTFGLYGTVLSAKIFTGVLWRLKNSTSLKLQLVKDVNTILEFCKEILARSVHAFAKYSKKDRLMLFVHPKVRRLLELLRKFQPTSTYDVESHGAASQFCGIIFVERRCTANVLYSYLEEIQRHDRSLAFIKPLFTVGQAGGKAGPSTIKESSALNKNQKEVMREFREGRCNLIVATSVLEEGVDIPACNVIIRFDKIKTYCDYVQTKGRARSKKAFYCMLVSENDIDSCLNDFMQLHAIEQELLASCDFTDNPTDSLEVILNKVFAPYAPFGVNGPRITYQSTIGLLHRYCSQLPSDGKIASLKWSLVEVSANDVEDAWMSQLQSVLTRAPFLSFSDLPPTFSEFNERAVSSRYFQCALKLPKECPIKEEVLSDPMPNKRLAKRSAALKACIKLHQLGELDDDHLIPVRQTSVKNTQINPGVIKDEIKQEEPAEVVAVSDNGAPVAGAIDHLYLVEFVLKKPTQDRQCLILVGLDKVRLGLLTCNPIPALNAFYLATESGDVEVKFKNIGPKLVTDKEIQLLEDFHGFINTKIVLFGEKLQVTSPRSSPILIVPIDSNGEIDFLFAAEMIRLSSIDWTLPPQQKPFHFNKEKYKDAVVVLGDPIEPDVAIGYVDSITELTPGSQYHDHRYSNYREYYQKKFNLNVTNEAQNLLQVVRETTNINFLIPRDSAGSTDFVIIAPEFCRLHPMPASVWKQAVLMPSVLHRLEGLLLAEQLRMVIASETHIGVQFLPGITNANYSWPPLLVNKRDISLNNVQTNEMKDKLSGLGASIASRLKNSRIAFHDFLERKFVEREFHGKRFDTENITSSSSIIGPSPGLLLEATTPPRVGDSFNWERLKWVGMSFLNLTSSVYAIEMSGPDVYDKSLLYWMKMQKLNDGNLAQLGQQKGLEKYLALSKFQVGETLQPEITTNLDTDPLKKLMLERDVACCVASIVGAYLVTAGIKSAVSVMEWIGLKISPERDRTHLNQLNGFPVLQMDCISDEFIGSDEDERMELKLYSGLESLEKQLDYTFHQKRILIEAVTHPSYFSNQLTPSYKRLRFLGSSVLDFLLMRYLYDEANSSCSLEDLIRLHTTVLHRTNLAMVAAKYNFQCHLKYMSRNLMLEIEQFVCTQEDNWYHLRDHKSSDSNTANRGEEIEAPKVLSDLFESLAGAIFIDSEMSLDAVWKSYSTYFLDILCCV